MSTSGKLIKKQKLFIILAILIEFFFEAKISKAWLKIMSATDWVVVPIFFHYFFVLFFWKIARSWLLTCTSTAWFSDIQGCFSRLKNFFCLLEIWKVLFYFVMREKICKIKVFLTYILKNIEKYFFCNTTINFYFPGFLLDFWPPKKMFSLTDWWWNE